MRITKPSYISYVASWAAGIWRQWNNNQPNGILTRKWNSHPLFSNFSNIKYGITYRKLENKRHVHYKHVTKHLQISWPSIQSMSYFCKIENFSKWRCWKNFFWILGVSHRFIILYFLGIKKTLLRFPITYKWVSIWPLRHFL